MKAYPKVRSVIALADKRLLVTFENDERKIYNCTPLLKEEPFRSLADEWLFKSVKADPAGYGISWDEDIDLSESELWENGTTPPLMPS